MSVIFGLLQRTGRPVCESVLSMMDQAASRWAAVPGGLWRQGPVALGCRHFPRPQTAASDGRLPRDRSGTAFFSVTARLDERDSLLTLPGASHRPSAVVDAELVVRAWEQWGPDCPKHLYGDFSFAVWDDVRQQLFLARDAFGQHGLYYYNSPDLFVFGSSLAMVLAAPGVPRELNPAGLATMARGYPRGNKTPWRNVYRLPVASTLTVGSDRLTTNQYWHPGHVADVRLSRDEDYVDAFREVYAAAVRSRLKSRGAVGVTLSGGLDSGSTAALAARELQQSGRRLTALSSVPVDDCDDTDFPALIGNERPQIEMMQRHCPNLDVHFVSAEDISPLEGLKTLVQYCDHPFVAASNAFWLCGLMKEARQQQLDLLMTGHGGNFTVSWQGNRDGYLNSLLRTGRLLKWASEIRAWRRHHQLSVYRTLTHQVGRSLMSAQWIRRQKWRRAVMTECLFSEDFLSSLDGEQPDISSELLAGHPNSARRKLSAMMTTDANIGWREAGATAGIDITTPALDRRVIEFCLGIPEDQYTCDGHRKVLIRRAMKDLMPHDVLWHRRKGRQAGDIIHRMRKDRDETAGLLTELKSCGLCSSILNLDGMTHVFETLQTTINPEVSRQTATLLLAGLMTGLFLRRFESSHSAQIRSAA